MNVYQAEHTLETVKMDCVLTEWSVWRQLTTRASDNLFPNLF